MGGRGASGAEKARPARMVSHENAVAPASSGLSQARVNKTGDGSSWGVSPSGMTKKLNQKRGYSKRSCLDSQWCLSEKQQGQDSDYPLQTAKLHRPLPFAPAIPMSTDLQTHFAL